MHKLLASLTMASLLTACGGDIYGTNSNQSSNGIRVSSADPENSTSLDGVWQQTDTASQCTETYILEPDLTFRLESLDRRASGTYLETENTASTRDRISFSLTDDNEETNCFGLVGPYNTYQVYYWTLSGDTLYLYRQMADSTPAMIWTKQSSSSLNSAQEASINLLR